jgi:hypothetical protein
LALLCANKVCFLVRALRSQKTKYLVFMPRQL